MTSRLFVDEVDDMSCLTDEQLSGLRIKNNYDKISNLSRIFQLSSLLELTIDQSHQELKLYISAYKQQKYNIVRNVQQCIYYCLRWRCRGLSPEQTVRKLQYAQQARTEWMKNQNLFWK